jgi:Flp pilus assembly protein TadG
MTFRHLLRRAPLGRFRADTAGGAMVEFAVVFPVLVLLLIGAADFGRFFFTSIAVANAARAGAEWGAFNAANAISQTSIQNFAQQDGAEAGTVTVTSQRICRCGTTVTACSTLNCDGYGPPKVFVEVTATKTVNLILPYPGVPNNIVISRTATFRQQ